MFNGEVIQFDRIAFRATTEGDLDCVLKMERAAENAAFIRQWSIEQHKSAISNENMAHLIVQKTLDSRAIGYIILVGLKNPDKSIEFKRIVINEKNEGFGRESLQLVKKMAFENLGAHRLWLEVVEDERSSASAIQIRRVYLRRCAPRELETKRAFCITKSYVNVGTGI